MKEQSFPNDEPLKALQAMSALHSCCSGNQDRPVGAQYPKTIENTFHVIRPVATIMTLSDVLAHDVHLSAVHESGHLVVAEHYGLKCRIELTNQFAEIGGDYDDYTTVKGQTFHPNATNHFALSVTGWGGLVAEVAVGEEITDAEILAIETREQFDLGQLSVSHSDFENIFNHPQPWRALKTAARIVILMLARIDEITRLALRHMIDEKQMRFNYPTLADHVTT